MKVKVTKQDIEEGRHSAGSKCGCPIHRALGRKLRIPIYPDHQSSNALLVPDWNTARLGRIRIPLPEEARVFQERLIDDPHANVRSFEFETELLGPK